VLTILALLVAVASAGYIGGGLVPGYGGAIIGGGYGGYGYGGYGGYGSLIGAYSSERYIPGPTIIRSFSSTPVVRRTVISSPGYGYGYGGLVGGYGGGIIAGGW